MSVSRNGFTLIEILVTLLVLGPLVALALPFSRDWSDANRQLQMASRLGEGIALARAVALRNPNALSADGEPVEAVRLHHAGGDNSLAVVLRQADGNWPALDAPPFWRSTPLSGTLVLKAGAVPFTCLAYDTRGRLQGNGDCALPAGVSRIAIEIGNLEPSHVEAW